MEDETRLVKIGDLNKALEELKTKENTIIDDIEKVLPYIKDEKLKKDLLTKLTRSQECITALNSGFIPIDGGWFTNLDTKAKWNKKYIKDILETMPEDVKEVLERVKSLGVFKTFGVQGGRRGDPMLVGTTGKKNFFIASWVNFPGGYTISMKVRQ